MDLHDYKTGGAYSVARYGEQVAKKLTEAQAMQIKRRVAYRASCIAEARKLSNHALADKFGMHHKSVCRILNSERGYQKPYGSMSLADYEMLRECGRERARLLNEALEHSNAAIAAEYGVSPNLVSRIGAGLCWVRLPELEDL